MKTMMLAAVMLVMTAAFMPAGVRAADSCDGTFTVGDSTVTLKSVYVTLDRLFSEPGKDYLRVVLSDVPVTPAQATDDFALQKLTRDGKLHAVILIVNPDKQVVSTQLYDPGFKMDSVSSAGTNNRLDPTAMDKTHIAGKAYTKEPREFRNVAYEYAATFDGAIHR
jgi:hypothetical protein